MLLYLSTSFLVKEANLDMKCLHNMAQPIVDDALGHWAIDGSWRTTPMMIQLGSVLVDTKKVRVDEHSYFQMEKYDDTTDLERCQ
jgi:hypothetical protein